MFNLETEFWTACEDGEVIEELDYLKPDRKAIAI